MGLTHRNVEIFAAVMRAGTVTRAAELLGTSQPTVSRELGQLERNLQLSLFERRRGRLFPSAQALELFAEVQRSYAGLERINAAAEALRRSGVEPLSIACLPTFAETLLPRALLALHADHPEACLSIATLESPLLDTWLTEQRVHVGLVEQSEAPPGNDSVPLLTADEVCVLPAGHPLLSRRTLGLRDFEGERFISFGPGDPYRASIDGVFERARVERACRIDTTSAASACAMVAQGLGISLVNPLTALQQASDRLHVRPVRFSIPFHVSLVRAQHRGRHPLEVPFTEALIRLAPKLLAELRRAMRCAR